MTVALDVIVTTYNKPQELALVLDGFSRQTERNFRLHVVNDGGECVKDVIAKFKRLGIQYHYLGPKSSDFRLAAARNVALRICTAPRVLVHDGDTVPCPELTAIHAGYGGQLAIVGGNRIGVSYEKWRGLKDTTGISKLGDGVRIIAPSRQCTWEIVCISRWDAASECYIEPYRDAWGPSVSVPTFPTQRIGGYWEEFVGWGGEDAELAMRLCRMGCQNLIRPDAIIYHLDHTTCEPQSAEDRAAMQTRVCTLFNASLQNPSLVRNKSGLGEPLI